MDNIAQVCLCSWDSNMVQEIPSSDSFDSPLKKGFLYKLVGKGWLYSGSWKARYCVLDGSKFYFYESEQSKGHEKTCGVINLDYYDVCDEDTVRDKKQHHVFVIGTSVRGFFDNRHQFAAESGDDLQSWIHAIQSAIAEARISRRKPASRKQRQQPEGKSPDLSTSSQESEGASTACLVNVAKDRAKGPQGRRLPQRKSMMPTTKSAEDIDLRQRSTSLSSPQNKAMEEEEEESTSPKTNSESKWISLSMEDMDRERADVSGQRSSSTFDIAENGDRPAKPHKRPGPRHGVGLLGQHAALTRELEMKLKAGMAPGARRPPTPDEEDDDEASKKDAVASKKIEILSTQVSLTKDDLEALEHKVSELTNQVDAATEQSEQTRSQVGDILLQVTVTLKEAERINEECRRALAEASRARTEYKNLVKECKEMMADLSAETNSK